MVTKPKGLLMKVDPKPTLHQMGIKQVGYILSTWKTRKPDSIKNWIFTVEQKA